MSELDVMFPSGKDVVIKGETLTIMPFKFGQLPAVFRIIEPISTSAFSVGAMPTNQAVARLMADGGEPLILLMSFTTGKPREWFDILDMDEGITLLTAVVEVNYDFFIQKVLPIMTPFLEKMGK